MLNMAINMAQMRHRVLIVSLELTPGEMALRAAAMLAGVPLHRIEGGFRKQDKVKWSEQELSRWDVATKKVVEIMMFLRIHGADENGREIRDVMRSAVQHNYDAVFIDHVGMIGRDSGGRPLDKISDTIHHLRALSRGEIDPKCRPFVCATSPLNRDSQKGDEDEPRAPRLADFFGSSRIEYDTDAAIILQKRKEQEEDGSCIVDAFVLKNRQGRCPAVLQFDANGATCTVTERKRPDEERPQNWQDTDDHEEAT